MNEEEEAAAVAAAAAAWYYHQQLQTRARRLIYRPPYGYVRRSFSLELMPPGRARIWLRFTPKEIQRLVPLLHLYEVEYRNQYQSDAETALCVVAAWLSFPSRWEHLCDLFGRSKSWLSTVFNDTILFLVTCFAPLLLWHP